MTPTDNPMLSSKLDVIRRRRTIWWACWVPGAYGLTLLFHRLTGELPPYFAIVLLMFAWVFVGYGGALLAYRKVIGAAAVRSTFIDAVALRIPAEAASLVPANESASARRPSRGPLSGPGGEAR